jgi:alanyl-tRNA synthetase
LLVLKNLKDQIKELKNELENAQSQTSTPINEELLVIQKL